MKIFRRFDGFFPSTSSSFALVWWDRTGWSNGILVGLGILFDRVGCSCDGLVIDLFQLNGGLGFFFGMLLAVEGNGFYA